MDKETNLIQSYKLN